VSSTEFSEIQTQAHNITENKIILFITKWNPCDSEIEHKVQPVSKAPLHSLVVFLAGMKMFADQINIYNISTSLFLAESRWPAFQAKLHVNVFVHV